MNDSVMISKLSYDVLKTVAKPMSTLREFKTEILEVLAENFPSCDFQFSSYNETSDENCRYMISDMVGKGLPEFFQSEDWINNYFSTYIFNPNKNTVIREADRTVFRVTDIMSEKDYENCRNYREIMHPYGYYYPLQAMLKDGSGYIGQISVVRKKDMGDFSDEDAKTLEDVCPYLVSRMIDYREKSGKMYLQKEFLDRFGTVSRGMLLLDEHFRFIAANRRGEECCADLFYGRNDEPDEDCYFSMASVVRKQLEAGQNRYKQYSLFGGREYFISAEEYKIPKEDQICLCYLVCLGTEGFDRTEAVMPAQSRALSRLSNRQLEVVQLMAGGLTTRQIAEQLTISESTVKKHIENIRVTLGVSNRIAILKTLDMLH